MHMHKGDVTMRRLRLKPEGVALQHVRSATDNASFLEARHINPIKGRGVFAVSPFQRGDFVVEYRGEIIDSTESQARRKKYHPSQAVFMFDFYWQGKQWCMDASVENGSLGRLVNDDHVKPNCWMKKIVADGKPHLVLFALKNIERGDEIAYDYGGSDWPWRVDKNRKKKQVGSSDKTGVQDTNVVSPLILKVDGGHSANDAFIKRNKVRVESSDRTEVQYTAEVSPLILKVDGGHSTNDAFMNRDKERVESSDRTEGQDTAEVSPLILKVKKFPVNSLVEYTDSEVSSGPDLSSPQPDTVSDLPSSSIQIVW
ncbi:uncharacterized protein [Pseudorasbora parva]|uniref:uncharacterized protein n=1 Tax=Pseudorasbora parva TaxID=51549 RepID=UPI00351E56EE